MMYSVCLVWLLTFSNYIYLQFVSPITRMTRATTCSATLIFFNNCMQYYRPGLPCCCSTLNVVVKHALDRSFIKRNSSTIIDYSIPLAQTRCLPWIIYCKFKVLIHFTTCTCVRFLILSLLINLPAGNSGTYIRRFSINYM